VPVTLYLPAMSGGALFVVLEVVEVLLVVLVLLEVSVLLEVEELVDLHPITHATNNAKTSAVLCRGKRFIVVSFNVDSIWGERGLYNQF
jgi:hypothetical protein